MRTAHAQYRAGNSGRRRRGRGRGTAFHGQGRRATVGDQESGARSSRNRSNGFERTCAGWRRKRRRGDWSAEIWKMATQTYGEAELQDLKDVHWKALTVLDKLHKHDRRVREKETAEYAKEASKGAAGLLHRLTKPRAVWCPRGAAQGEATNPRDAAELAVRSWARIWRIHVDELQEADRPWEVPRPRGSVGIAAPHRGRSGGFHRASE